MDAAGEVRSGRQPRESRHPCHRTRDAPQPVRDPVEGREYQWRSHGTLSITVLLWNTLHSCRRRTARLDQIVDHDDARRLRVGDLQGLSRPSKQGLHVRQVHYAASPAVRSKSWKSFRPWSGLNAGSALIRSSSFGPVADFFQSFSAWRRRAIGDVLVGRGLSVVGLREGRVDTGHVVQDEVVVASVQQGEVGLALGVGGELAEGLDVAESRVGFGVLGGGPGRGGEIGRRLLVLIQLLPGPAALDPQLREVGGRRDAAGVGQRWPGRAGPRAPAWRRGRRRAPPRFRPSERP